MRGKRHRCLATFALTSVGVVVLLWGVGLTSLVERYVSPDHVVEARTRALLWTIRVRLIVFGAGVVLAGLALGIGSLRERLRQFNTHPNSRIAVAGLIFLYAVTGLYVDPHLVSDLRPVPDAVEYASSARQLMMTRSYAIVVEGEAFPPRYPVGYPLLIVPFYWAFGAQLCNAVLCSLTLVGVAAVFVYCAGERAGGRAAGILAALFMLSSPAVIDAGRSVMSEAAAMLGIASAVWFLVRLVEQERSAWSWGSLGVCIGAGAIVRFSNILLLAPAGLILLSLHRGRPRTLIGAFASLCAGCGIALAPLLVYQAQTFGGMLRTAYSFWVPYYFDLPGKAFGVSYAFQKAGMGDSDSSLPNILFYGALLAGGGRTYYALPTAIFVALGGVISLGRRDVRCLRSATGDGATEPGDRPHISCHKLRIVGQFVAGATTITVLFYTFYFAADQRFLTPLIPLLTLLAGVGATAIVNLRSSGWPRGGAAFCNVFFLWGGVEWLIAFGGGSTADVPRRHEIARLVARRTERDAVVVSGIDPLFLGEIAGRRVIPVSRRVEYASKIVLSRPIREAVPEEIALDPSRYEAWALARGARRPVPLVATEAPERIADLLEEGRPVYCDDYDLRGDEATLRLRFRFEPVDSVAGIHLYRLRVP